MKEEKEEQQKLWLWYLVSTTKAKLLLEATLFIIIFTLPEVDIQVDMHGHFGSTYMSTSGN